MYHVPGLLAPEAAPASDATRLLQQVRALARSNQCQPQPQRQQQEEQQQQSENQQQQEQQEQHRTW